MPRNKEKQRLYTNLYRSTHKKQIKASRKAWRKANKEKEKVIYKRYYETHKEQIKAYYETHKKQSKARARAWYKVNKVKATARRKAWYKANKEKRKMQIKAYCKNNPEIVRNASRKRRALKYKTQVESINEKIVFMRDGWICQICHKRVDKKFKHPNPMSASLDHIVPMNKGGTHTYNNVQLAHLRCNMEKHYNTLPQGEQMRLF